MSPPYKETLAANGSTTGTDWSGDGTLFATGTWGAGTIKLQLSPDGGTTWIDATDSAGAVPTLTANGAINFSAGNSKVRATLTGATAPSLAISFQPR